MRSRIPTSPFTTKLLPSNYLETLLWAEADRLSGLTVDEANFKSERSVVEEEYRQTYLAPPYGMLDYLIQQQSLHSHIHISDRRSGASKIWMLLHSITCAPFTRPSTALTMPRW